MGDFDITVVSTVDSLSFSSSSESVPEKPSMQKIGVEKVEEKRWLLCTRLERPDTLRITGVEDSAKYPRIMFVQEIETCEQTFEI